MAESSRDLSGLGLDELKALLVQALEEVARLKAENAELREEIARLKGLKERPKLKPSGMAKAAGGRGTAAQSGRRSPLTRPGSSSRTACRKAPASRAMKTSSFRISSSSHGQSATGASAGCCPRARRWRPHCQRGQPAISVLTSSV